MSVKLQQLDQLVKEVAPIYGVSIIDELDKQTWTIQFKEEATEEQRTHALMVLNSFDFSALTEADYAVAIQTLVDGTAKARGYADGVALASYVTSSVPTWNSEAKVFIPWRDAVWVYAYQQLAAVSSGQRPAPTIEQLLLELPTIEWPTNG